MDTPQPSPRFAPLRRRSPRHATPLYQVDGEPVGGKNGVTVDGVKDRLRGTPGTKVTYSTYYTYYTLLHLPNTKVNWPLP